MKNNILRLDEQQISENNSIGEILHRTLLALISIQIFLKLIGISWANSVWEYLLIYQSALFLDRFLRIKKNAFTTKFSFADIIEISTSFIIFVGCGIILLFKNGNYSIIINGRLSSLSCIIIYTILSLPVMIVYIIRKRKYILFEKQDK